MSTEFVLRSFLYSFFFFLSNILLSLGMIFEKAFPLLSNILQCISTISMTISTLPSISLPMTYIYPKHLASLFSLGWPLYLPSQLFHSCMMTDFFHLQVFVLFLYWEVYEWFRILPM